jgi:ankyrin repeat protein
MSDVQEILAAVKDGNLPRVKELLEMDSGLLEAVYIHETPLIAAITNNHVPIVEYLLSVGADPIHEAGFGIGPIHTAVSRGNTTIVARLLDAGANVNELSSYRIYPPLVIAVKKCDIPMTKLLIERGAKINYEEEGYPVSSLSTTGARCDDPVKHFEIVRFLVDQGIDLTIAGKSILENAIGKNNMPLFDYLLTNKIGVDADPSDLFLACFQNKDMLVRLMAQFDIKKYGGKLLDRAARSRLSDFVNELLDRGAPLPDKSLYLGLDVPTIKRLMAMGMKPDIHAYYDLIKMGDIEKLRVVAEKGIDGFNPTLLLAFAYTWGKKKEIRDFIFGQIDITKYGGKLLATAIDQGDTTFVDSLLAMNVNVNCSEEAGPSPLSVALSKVRYETNEGKLTYGIELVKQLVKRGASVQKEDLLHVIKLNSLDLLVQCMEKVVGAIDPLELLLEAMKTSAKKDILTFLLEKIDLAKSGRVVLSMAIDTNNAELVDRLLSMKVDVNDPLGIETPLIHAARKNNMALVKRLLEMGADQKAKTSQGLIACMASTDPEIRELLSPRWKGFTKSDVSKLRVVFDTEVPQNGGIVPAINYSMCPVCLAFIERKDACAIMSHECEKEVDRPDNIVFSRALHDTYMDHKDRIFWCTICNRICEGHNHLQIGPVEGPVPEKAVVVSDSDDYFTDDCRTNIGGGGVPEKVMRFQGFLAEAAALQPLVGSISEVEAKKRLVKALWDAPLRAGAKNAANAMIGKKQFNSNNSAFAANFVPASSSSSASSASSASSSSSTAENEVVTIPNYNASLVPVVSDIDDEEDVVELHHRRMDGKVSDHTNDKYEVMSIDDLMNLVDLMNKERGDKKVFAKCPFKPCDAWIYPQEIESALGQAKHVADMAAYQAILETYKGHFNRRFGKEKAGQAGGRRTLKSRKIKKSRKNKIFRKKNTRRMIYS